MKLKVVILAAAVVGYAWLLYAGEGVRRTQMRTYTANTNSAWTTNDIIPEAGWLSKALITVTSGRTADVYFSDSDGQLLLSNTYVGSTIVSNNAFPFVGLMVRTQLGTANANAQTEVSITLTISQVK